MICKKCKKTMCSKPIYDDQENRFYKECRNQNKDGSICWHTQWID